MSANLLDPSLLDFALSKAQEGQGQILLFSDPQDRVLAAGLEAWIASQGAQGPWVVQVNLRNTCALPYAPFLDIVVRYAELHGRDAMSSILEEAALYHRHLPLFHIVLGLRPLADLNQIEELILEEILMEKKFIKDGLKRILTIISRSRPILVHCRGAENMGEEAIALIRSQTFLDGLNVLVLADFGLPASNTEQEQYYQEMDSRGHILHLSETVAHMSLTPVRLAGNEDSLEMLLQFLCFDTVLRLTHEAEPTIRVAIWRTRCHEAREEFEEALLDLQDILLADQEVSSLERCTMLRLASRQYRYLNDPEMAVRLAAQAAELAREAKEVQEMARADFMQFLLSSVAILAPDELDALELRLGKRLSQLSWHNHRAYFLGQSAGALRTFRSKGLAAALARCGEAVALARSMGNIRRLGTCLHATALVWQTAGDLVKSASYYRKIRGVYEDIVLPQELARIYNGHGFMLFTMGEYQQALRNHGKALNLLKLTRHFEETLVTGVNVARIQLFAGSYQEAKALLESVVVVLDILRIRDLPFMERETIDSLLGLACLKAGVLAPAQEIARRLDQEFGKRERNPHAGAYRAWFHALLAMSRKDIALAAQAWDHARRCYDQMPKEVRYLFIKILIDQADAVEMLFDSHGAHRLRMEALSLCLPAPQQEFDRQVLEAALDGKPRPPGPRLHRVALDPGAILDSVQQDVRLRAWRRTARSSVFLRSWQEILNHEHEGPRLFAQCRLLLKRHFLVDEVIIDSLDKLPQDLVERYGQGMAWFEGSALEGTAYRTLTWIPCIASGHNTPACLVASRRGSPFYTLDDHRVVLIAMRYLDTTLLARQRTTELETRKIALEDALEKLTLAQNQLIQSEKLAALGSLVAGIAHEINTPIGIAVTGVSYQVDMTKSFERHYMDNSLSRSEMEVYLGKMKEGGELVLRNLQRADRLIQNFKQVATDQTSEQQRKFKLLAYLGEVLGSLEPTYKKTSIAVELEGDPNIEIDSYPGAIAQIITNLLVNCLTHAFDPGDRGTIRFTVSRTASGEAELRCKDSGKGVSADVLGKIFDPFYTTKRNKGNTGLGLHIVFNLVHSLLGGTISCQSEPGEGTCFRIILPVMAPEMV